MLKFWIGVGDKSTVKWPTSNSVSKSRVDIETWQDIQPLHKIYILITL
jgi:hypothetical protein